MRRAKNTPLLLPVLALLYLAVLYIHTAILYGETLPPARLLLQAFYRTLVAVAPLAFVSLHAAQRRNAARYLALAFVIFLIPYPLYNFFQLRHIAEIFRIPNGAYFTRTGQVNMLWKLLPVSVYAVSQLLVFLICLKRLNDSLNLKPHIVPAGLCLLSAFAVTIGLATRLDTFHILTDPLLALDALTGGLGKAASLLNTGAIFLFAFGAYGVFVYLSAGPPPLEE